MTSTSMSDLIRDTDDMILQETTKNNAQSPPHYEIGVFTNCRTCLSNSANCNCCDTTSTLCTSAATNFKWFPYIVLAAVVWFIISVAIVSSDRTNYWNEFETLLQKEDPNFTTSIGNNATVVLFRNAMAISLKYTESMSLFLVFSTFISAMIYGPLFGMLVHRCAELYSVNNNRYEFTNNVPEK